MQADARSPRPYRSALRAERSRLTRRRVLRAATGSFTTHGFAGTTMRGVATAAGVSVATVEQAFGTKAVLLKGAIDVAITGDDEPVAVLDRDWAARAAAVTSADEFLVITTEVLAAAMQRSAGLVLAVFDGPAELADLRAQLVAQRAGTAGWIVDRLSALGPLRDGLDRAGAVDTVWVLMDPAVFVRLTRVRGRSVGWYRGWVASAMRNLVLERGRT